MAPADDTGALAGVIVLELGHGIAGPFAARLLADLGADVIKVEKPEAGDFARRLEPFTTDEDGLECSALFEFLNWNKRGVALDLGEPEDRDPLLRLVRHADIVIESLAPGRLAAWGLGHTRLHALNPRLVITAVTNFGLTGPYSGWRGSDLVFQAMSGLAQISGTSDRPPLKRGIRQSLYCAGINAAYASLAGLLAARRTGAGVHLDLAIRECPASELVLNESWYVCMGAVQGRRPPVRDPLGGPLGGGDPLPTRDGHAALQVSPHVTTARLGEIFGEPRLGDPRFATTEGRAAHAPELIRILTDLLGNQTSRDVFERASRGGLLAGSVQDAAALLECEQLRERDVFRTVPGLGSLRFPAVLAEFSRTPARIRRRAPRLGQHTDEVLGELAGDRTGQDGTRDGGDAGDAGAPATGPLAGLRVLDLSYVFAAPYIGGILSDLGAEVIKIEAPRRLDQCRSSFSPFFENAPGDSYWDRAGAFHVVNRGKRSLSLDLSTPQGREILRSLVAEADILLENYTPRVMRGWGMSYGELAELNPRLVMLSNTGFGSTGPWSPFRAQGTTLEATMGLTRHAGYDGGPPTKVGQSYPDFLACWSGLLAVLAALVDRERTGRGQWLDLGMYQLGVSVIPEVVLGYQCGADEPERTGSGEPGARFSGMFRCRGDDRWLAVTAFSEKQLAALHELTGGVPGRLTDAMAAWSKTRDAADAAAVLQARGVPAGPTLDARELLLDPQLAHRGFYEPIACGDGTARPIIGRPYRWRSERSLARVLAAAPDFGEANRHVLQDMLGLDAGAADQLEAAGIVTSAPIDPAPVQPVDLQLMLSRGVIARLDAEYQDVLNTTHHDDEESKRCTVTSTTTV